MHGELLEFNENLQKTVQVLEIYSCQLLRTTYLGNNFVSDGHVCNTFCPVLLKLLDV